MRAPAAEDPAPPSSSCRQLRASADAARTATTAVVRRRDRHSSAPIVGREHGQTRQDWCADWCADRVRGLRRRGTGARRAGRGRPGPAQGRPDDVQDHRDDVREPDDDLDDDRLGLDAEHAGEHRREHGARPDQPGEVDGLRLPDVEPARLVRGVRRGGEQAGGDEHQHDAGDGEEALQVDPHAAAVDAVAEPDRDDDAEHGAEPGGQRSDAGLERREQEHRRSRSPRAARRGTPSRPAPRPSRRRAPSPADISRCFFMPAGVPAHPHDHVGDHRDGDEPDDRLQRLLLLLRQVGARRPAAATANAGAQRRPRSRRRPTPSGRRRAGRWRRNAATMPDDQRGLEAFAQTDDERGQHAVLRIRFA